MSQLAQLVQPVVTTNPTGTGSYVDASNTNPALNTSAASLTANSKGVLSLLASTDPVQTYGSNSFTNITLSTTTVVKSGAGTLIGIETGNAGTTNVVTIYDNTAASGTKIGTTTVWTDRTRIYNVSFGTGLTISTGAACDITVIYR